MALETVGLLVNIAGDAGGLINAVNGATKAFQAFQQTSTKAGVESMPAFKILQSQIDAVTARVSIAKRQQSDYTMVMDATKAKLAEVSAMTAKLTADFQHQRDYGVAPTEKEIDAYDKKMASLINQQTNLEKILQRTTREQANANDKVAAGEARINKLNVQLEQVRGPQTRWEAFFALIKSGVSVFNSAQPVIEKVLALFKGDIGLKAFADSLLFNKPIDGLKKVSDSSKKASTDLNSIGIVAGLMSAGTTFALNAVVSVLNGVSTAIQSAINSAINFAKEATIGAAREEEIGLAAEYMGSLVGLSVEKVDSLREKLEEAGATGDTAGTALTKFAQHGMDTAKAIDLLNVAQGASIVTGRDAQTVYEDLIEASSRQTARTLKQYGILIDVTQAEEEYAKKIGKSKDALDEADKANAFLNATLEKGAKLSALYAEGMKLPSAQLRDLTSRAIPELMDAIGRPFTQTFFNLVTPIKEFVDTLAEAINSGKGLGLVINDLGAIATWVSGIFKGKFEDALGILKDPDSFAWGHNLIVQFANGIVDGINAVVDALNAVASTVSYWLSPGSPPKLLPDIDKWGEGTMAAWMEGWNEVDFSLMSNVSGKLKGFMDSLGEDAFGGKEGKAGAMQGIRDSITMAIEEIQQFGDVTKETINQISSSFGSSAGLVQRYTTALFDMEKANRKVQAAQDNLSAVTKKYDDQLTQLNAKLAASQEKKTVAEEDAQIKALQRVLTRASSTDKQRAAAQAELDDIMLKRKIRQTETEKTAAVSAAQTKLTAAQEEQKVAAQRLAVQQGLIDAQQESNDLLKQALDTANKLANAMSGGGGVGGGGAGKGIGSGFQKPKVEIETPQFIKDLQYKIDVIHDKWSHFADTFGKIWDNVKGRATDAWNNYLLPALQTTWAWIEANLIPILKNVWSWLQENWPVAVQTATDFWNNTLLPAIQAAWKWINESLIPTLITVWGWLQENWPKAIQAVKDAWDWVLKAMQDVHKWITETLIPKIIEVRDWLSDKKEGLGNIVKKLADFWENVLLPAIMFVWKWLSTILIPFFKSWFNLMTAIWQPILDTFMGFWTLLLIAMQGVWGWIVAIFLPMWVQFHTFFQVNLLPIITAIAEYLLGTFLNAMKSIYEFITGTLIPLALTAIVTEFANISTKVKEVTGFFNDLATAIRNLPKPNLSGLVGAASAAFGGAKAIGGDTEAGKVYLVGERGPELFRSKYAGTIFNNDETLGLFRNSVKSLMPMSVINSGYNRSSVTYNRNNYLNVNSSAPSQGLINDWGRLNLLGA